MILKHKVLSIYYFAILLRSGNKVQNYERKEGNSFKNLSHVNTMPCIFMFTLSFNPHVNFVK